MLKKNSINHYFLKKIREHKKMAYNIEGFSYFLLYFMKIMNIIKQSIKETQFIE